MFQRLKGFNLDSFLDSKIAEEQAKQAKPSQSSPSKRTPNNASPRRGGAETDSPARKPNSRLAPPEGGADGGPAGKGPDPEEFVIGDDVSDISRTVSPMPPKDGAEEPVPDASGKHDAAPSKHKVKEKMVDDELPEDVRKKLLKLESYTAKYQDLLRNYRIAHARVAAIEPFEATLRENTPLTSIADPDALVEFLNQRSLQSDMVLEELKRITGEHKGVVKERDELKVKLEEAEKVAKEAFDEAAGLRKVDKDADDTAKAGKSDHAAHPVGGSVISPNTLKSTSIGSEAQNQSGGDEFFSYETEQARGLEEQIEQHELELRRRAEYINELSTENAAMRQDLDMTQLELSAMQNKVGIRDREIHSLQSDLSRAQSSLEEAGRAREEAQEQEQEAAALLAQTEAEMVGLQIKLKDYQQSLAETNQKLKNEKDVAEENLRQYQKEHDENLRNGTYAQREEKGMDSLRKLVNTLRGQVTKADEVRIGAESRVNDLNFEMKRLEAEVASSESIIRTLRLKEEKFEALSTQLTEAEAKRDDAVRIADSKKGHEAAVASLRSQLKRAEKERDEAYGMILKCGKCEMPEQETEREIATPTEESSTPEMRSRMGSETTERTEASTQRTEVSTPSIDGDGLNAGETKKKSKKKKPRAKKGGSIDASVTVASPHTLTVKDLIANPEKAREMMKSGDSSAMIHLMMLSLEEAKQARENDDDERDAIIRHHEEEMEKQSQALDAMVTNEERRDEEFIALSQRFGETNAAMEKLELKLRGEEDLQEELEMIKGDLIERAVEATDAKHELQIMKKREVSSTQVLHELQTEHDSLAAKCKDLEAKLVKLNQAQTPSDANTEPLRAAQENVQALLHEKEELLLAKNAFEKEIHDLKAQLAADGARSGSALDSINQDFARLQSRAISLETDLKAAKQLAEVRHKDLTDLKEHHTLLQLDLERLRAETVQLNNVKSDLEKAHASIKKLEGKEKDLRSEIAEYKSQSAAKDGRIASLSDQRSKSEERTKALEESYENARQELERSQSNRDEATETKNRLQTDLSSANAELARSKTSLQDLKNQVHKFSDEVRSLREELQLKTTQQVSSHTLMESSQDQQRELATQLREVQARNESLDEELADAQRLLSERSREGETMRRLLNDVESRADSRVKEMRERMDIAIEERDRAEDEASNVGRRKAREIEDLKTRLRDAEREVTRVTEAREEAERKERDFQSRQADLDKRSAQAHQELDEIRTAMARLQETLDESERQCSELEKQKTDMRRSLEEREVRLEKLQKSSKSLTDELRTIQSVNKLRQGSLQSSRSSLESSRVTSPAPVRTSIGGASPGGAAARATREETLDYVYLKNILLQFLEQKEKKRQIQLVPVLGVLLHFDEQDRQKWMTAISAK